MRTGATRRAFLAGGVAAVALRRAPAAAADVDVVIIGAGAAGIGAGRRLKRLGRSFRILEASGRPGGRCFTDTSLGQPFDAGAAFIHWNERNPWSKIAGELGVEVIPEPDSSGFRVVFGEGQEPSPEARSNRRAAFGQFSDLIDERADSAPDISFADLARQGSPALLQAAAGMTLLNIGEEPERISIKDWQALWAGDDLVAPGGYGALVAKAAEALPVAYDTPVTAIDWGGSGVRATTAKGTITAAAAIVTVSVGVLQAEAIRFTPTLPAPTRDAIDGLQMGALTKVALRFDGERFGLEPNFDFFEVAGPRQLMNAEAWGFDRDLVVCMLGGDYAREICRAGEPAAVDQILGRVVGMLGGDARKRFQRGRLAGWFTDPLSLGCYASAKVGRHRARAALAAPVGQRLWFAGEASAGPAAMTAGGATLAGEQAAEAITRRLRG